MDRDPQRVTTFDLAARSVRELNQFLHHDLPALVTAGRSQVDVLHPGGQHSLAVGLQVPADVRIRGHAGYYIAGMNQLATVTIEGNVGWGVAENMMSGLVRVTGSCSECAGASAHGGLLIIEGDASSRCGISLKGADIVVGGDVGHMSAFMAQAGHLVVCGDAGPNLGDSLYEAVIYVRGTIHSLGTDAREEAVTEADRLVLARLLGQVGWDYPIEEFKRVASARSLYHWHAEHASQY